MVVPLLLAPEEQCIEGEEVWTDVTAALVTGEGKEEGGRKKKWSQTRALRINLKISLG